MAFSLCHDHHPYVNIVYRYIRFIYNRVILENAPVRAAAVAAMAQFGATCPDLLPNIQVV
jgi:coatomer protein complex subunit gamma